MCHPEYQDHQLSGLALQWEPWKIPQGYRQLNWGENERYNLSSELAGTCSKFELVIGFEHQAVHSVLGWEY